MYYRLCGIVALCCITLHNTSAMDKFQEMERRKHHDEQFNESVSLIGGIGAGLIPLITSCTIRWLAPPYISPFADIIITCGTYSGILAHTGGVFTLYEQYYKRHDHYPYSKYHFSKPKRLCKEQDWLNQDLFDIVADGDHHEWVRKLIEKGADRNAQDIHKNTPLQIAEKKGHTQTLSILRGSSPTGSAVSNIKQ